MRLSPPITQLSWPGGQRRFGYDKGHIASKGPVRFSAVARSGQARFDYLDKKVTTAVTGAPAAKINGIIGPAVSFTGLTDEIDATLDPAAAFTDVNFTIALIAQFAGVGQQQEIVVASGGGNLFTDVNTAGTIKLQGTNIVDTAIIPVVNTPYFIAASGSNGAVSFVLMNLRTGQFKKFSGSGTGAGAGPWGDISIGNLTGNNTPFNGVIAAVMYSACFLSVLELVQWAQDPWSFWYQAKAPDLQMVQLRGVAATPVDAGGKWPSTLLLPPRRGMVGWRGLVTPKPITQSANNPFFQTDWPLPQPIEPYPYRSFEWDNRLLLIGQDKLPFRQTDWPTPIAPEPDARRSWTWSYNLNLIGKDKLPFRQTDWPLPTPVDPPEGRRSWTWSYNLNLIGKDQLPFRQTDWPLPGNPETFPYRSFEWDNRKVLTGQDQLPFRQTDWPLPVWPEPDWRRGWTISLLQTTLTPSVVMPFRQTDWPLPGNPEPDARRSWTWSYNLNLIGKDQLPFRQSDWPLSIPADPVEGRRSWTWSYNLNLIGQDKLPFRQTDWPLPTAAPLLKTDQLPNLLPLTTIVVMPFRQTDWPLPMALEPDARRSWTGSFNLNLIGKDALPFRQTDWPLPQPIEPDARRSATGSYNLNLIGKDALPFRQTDWPLPLPASMWSAAQVIPNLVINLPPPPATTELPSHPTPHGSFVNFGYKFGS